MKKSGEVVVTQVITDYTSHRAELRNKNFVKNVKLPRGGRDNNVPERSLQNRGFEDEFY